MVCALGEPAILGALLPPIFTAKHVHKNVTQEGAGGGGGGGEY